MKKAEFLNSKFALSLGKLDIISSREISNNLIFKVNSPVDIALTFDIAVSNFSITI